MPALYLGQLLRQHVYNSSVQIDKVSGRSNLVSLVHGRSSYHFMPFRDVSHTFSTFSSISVLILSGLVNFDACSILQHLAASCSPCTMAVLPHAATDRPETRIARCPGTLLRYSHCRPQGGRCTCVAHPLEYDYINIIYDCTDIY